MAFRLRISKTPLIFKCFNLTFPYQAVQLDFSFELLRASMNPQTIYSNCIMAWQNWYAVTIPHHMRPSRARQESGACWLNVKASPFLFFCCPKLLKTSCCQAQLWEELYFHHISKHAWACRASAAPTDLFHSERRVQLRLFVPCGCVWESSASQQEPHFTSAVVAVGSHQYRRCGEMSENGGFFFLNVSMKALSRRWLYCSQKALFPVSSSVFYSNTKVGTKPWGVISQKHTVEWTVKIGGSLGGKSRALNMFFAGCKLKWQRERARAREEIKRLYVRNAQFACSDVAGTANEYLVGSHSLTEINAEWILVHARADFPEE